MESQRLERIELEERNLIHDTEAELMQLRARNNEKGDETSSLLNDLSRMEAQKDRLEAELSKLSQQLRDQKAQYQEDKSRAQAALHFHSQKEEVADQLQEESNSGKVNC
jgi:peptidoglycan hydrolase CwlO-like protein